MKVEMKIKNKTTKKISTITKEIGLGKTINLGFAIVPLKEIKMWLNTMGYDLLNIRVIE